MAKVRSVSIPDYMYARIVEEQKKDNIDFGFSRIFKIGYMRLTGENSENSKLNELALGTHNNAEKITRMVDLINKQAQRIEQLESEIYQKNNPSSSTAGLKPSRFKL